MKATLIFVSAGTMFLTLGCAISPKNQCKASIAHSPTEYDVCIGDKQVQTGDRIAFFKERCSGGGRSGPKRCHKEKVVEASVLKTLDEHLSTVKLDSEVELTEQMTIEKKQ
jgi:hypothetical protein